MERAVAVSPDTRRRPEARLRCLRTRSKASGVLQVRENFADERENHQL